MSRVTTMQVGKLRVHALEAGIQHLDGGAMFGVVPKPLWEKRIPADARNRIRLAMRTLLIEHDDGLVLVDSGLGNKETQKFLDIYGIENAGADGRTALEDALAELGHRPEDVKVVVSTAATPSSRPMTPSGACSRRSPMRATWRIVVSTPMRRMPTSAPPRVTSRTTMRR
jgi:hypothetical protein